MLPMAEMKVYASDAARKLGVLDGDTKFAVLRRMDSVGARCRRVSHLWKRLRWFVHDMQHLYDLEYLPDGTVQLENVRLLDRFNSRKPVVGTLYLTGTHLIFVDPVGKKEKWILHMHIASVEKLALSTAGSPIQIRCKNFMNVTFVIPRERDSHDIYTSLQHLSQPAELTELDAFHYRNPDLNDCRDGWNFDLRSEYLRMGVPDANWVLTNINKDYEMCDTYPCHLFVPAAVTTPVLVGSARFRSRCRLPALSYLHGNRAAMCRCSQPLSGFSARCVEDEQMLQAIRRANPASHYMYVIDTRPKINAMANRAAGKGYENENFYANIKFQFLGIENIHVMRSSLQKVTEVCELKNPSMSAFLSGLESSGWLRHIKSVVETSVIIAKAIRDGISVLVHCSDGWDRTAQTCSLASVMLDPYYRSIEGFQTLIEKEWLAFGHKFIDRCGLLGTVDSREVSPVFTQFLDGVWQVTRQFPTAFEFNERYLLTLHDHVHSCEYGTFIGNCEKDRIDLRLREKTYSLWSHLKKRIADFQNPFYKRESQLTEPVIIPMVNPQCFQFWRGMYCRFDSGLHPRENVLDIVSAMKDHTRSLHDHKLLLEKRISSLCQLLGRGEDQVQRSRQLLSSSESMDFHRLLLADPSPLGSPEQSVQKDITQPTENGGIVTDECDTENLQVYKLLQELQSVAVVWQSLRNVQNCGCAAPFEHFSKKYHCWRCGNIYCLRCIGRMTPLAGHLSQQEVPVCKACYRQTKHSPSPSITDFQHLERQVSIQSSDSVTS